ncbi:MAG: PAS domain S-box protein [Proteobacteria bacterium]|nr:PAS domain S-box protein [Pseudomonadota bacterium]MBU4576436.1 PAS domain S-box protein [Pseudomonadota bacterium]MBU4599091.1 PAS domain S-box protein [Pseudomonadota bacterium]MBV1714856.1 PAS domain S-box protein [Desulfarculus sp.]MBV1753136.1 PAS domain S-box protein [Desulfarculus sp.]
MPEYAAPQDKASRSWLRRVVTPPPADDSAGLPQWRERMFFFTLGPGLILGLLAYLMALPVLAKNAHYLVIVLDSVMLALTLTLFVLRQLPLATRVALLLLMIYGIGLAVMVTIGPLSSGPFWLFSIPILAALYLGLRPALLGLALNLATLLVLTWYTYTGQVVWAESLAAYQDQWLIIVSNFLFLNAATAIPVAILVGGLEGSLRRQRIVALELDRERDLLSQEVASRRRSEEALRLSERRYRDLIDSITDLIYTQDLQGRFLSANQATAAIFGYPPSELVGREGSQFMLPEHREAFYAEYLPTLRSEGFMSGLSQYLDAQGQKHYIEYRSTLVRPEKGEPYISGSGRDVTDRVLARQRLKQLEAQLLQSQKMEAMGTLAGGIAHDFNNVLASMLGFTELVLTDLPPDSPHRGDLEQVLKAGERAKGMVRRILTFSRHSESGRSPVAVQPVVAEALDLLRTSVPATITVERRLVAPRAMVLADPSQINQVVMNLATNAFQAMGSGGGVLNVTLEPVALDPEQAASFADLKPGPYLRLTVNDTGQGMDPKTMRRIFEPFFTTKDKSEGSGMGLAMVHNIVKNHGGQVTVHSRLGRGSVFEVHLPLLTGPTPPLPESPEQQVETGGGERVLLVDDEQPVGEMGRDMLEGLGYRVSLRLSGREALADLRRSPQDYDLVITDLTMPHTTGDELARDLYEIAPELPVVIATGYGGHLPQGELPPNVRLLLSKPYTRREMAQTVRRALEPA